MQLGTPAEYRARIWKSLAFVGRYASQPVDAWLCKPTADLMEYAEQVAEIMQEEGEALKGGFNA